MQTVAYKRLKELTTDRTIFRQTNPHSNKSQAILYLSGALKLALLSLTNIDWSSLERYDAARWLNLIIDAKMIQT